MQAHFGSRIPDALLAGVMTRLRTEFHGGLLLCDVAGGWLAANAAAEAMAEREWWLQRAGVVAFPSRVSQDGWQRALRGLPMATVFPVYDPLASLVALARCAPGPEGAGVVVALVIQPLRHEPTAEAAGVLRQLYDLTPGEAALLLALHRHGELALAASELGITQESARSRMKPVYAKTDLRRQADLLRLVDALARLYGMTG